MIDIVKEQLLHFKEAAAFLGVHPTTIKNYFVEGLEHVQIGRVVYTTKEAVQRYAIQNPAMLGGEKLKKKPGPGRGRKRKVASGSEVSTCNVSGSESSKLEQATPATPGDRDENEAQSNESIGVEPAESELEHGNAAETITELPTGFVDDKLPVGRTLVEGGTEREPTEGMTSHTHGEGGQHAPAN